MIKIILVEDDKELRQIYSSVLGSNPEFELLSAYPSAELFLDEIGDIFVDVVVMDIHLPGISGIDCVSMIKKERPEIQFMMLTVFEDNDKIFDSLRAGASGYLLKKSSPSKIYEAIKDLYNGGSPMSPEIAKKVILEFQKTFPRPKPIEELSKRENEILGYLVRGHRYKEIADLLFISLETVRTHIHNIYEKLQVNSKDEAIDKIKQVDETKNIEKYTSSYFKPEQIEKFAHEIDNYFKLNKPWLDFNLNLKKVSQLTTIPIHAISQAINQKFDRNFFDYVNHFRIEKAKELLFDVNNENKTIETIGYDCGFGTKVSFYTAFKKVTGKTPLEFKKSQA